MLRTLDRNIQEISAREDVLDDVVEGTLADRYRSEINETIDLVFGPGITRTARIRLRRLLALSLVKDDFSANRSGVVVAGFGSEERFPSLVCYELDGIIADRNKTRQVLEVDVKRSMRAAIVPFAQGEMVHTFMTGIDPEYKNYLFGAIPELVKQSCFAIVDGYVSGDRHIRSSAKQQIRVGLDKLIEQAHESFQDFERQRFSNPVVEMLDMLPKEEMANMAESLVNLTSLKRKVSPVVQSVGGPVDVAVISKGDGFVWIKRKHYFAPELNPSFFKNYFRGTDDARTEREKEDGEQIP